MKAERKQQKTPRLQPGRFFWFGGEASLWFVVHVAVVELFRGGFPNADDLDFEIQGFTGQRVVEVQHRGIVFDLGNHCIEHLPLVVAQLQGGADFHGNFGGKLALGDFHEGVGVFLTIALGRRHGHALAFAYGHAINLFLEAGDDVAFPLDELDGAVALGGIHHFTVHGEGVFQAYDIVVADDAFFLFAHNFLLPEL